MSRFPDLPDRMKSLPVDHRGFPVPWFVPWQDGLPTFPAMDPAKWVHAVNHGKCWVCGQPLGRFKHHLVGPMGLINAVSAEPPSHLQCAEFAAKHCPYIAQPRMGRVPKEKHGTVDHAGFMDQGNPGVWAMIETQGPIMVERTSTGPLIKIAPIAAVHWWTEGREATVDEAMAGFEARADKLRVIAERSSQLEREKLERRIEGARQWVPREIAA